jgi:hypothetical protein
MDKGFKAYKEEDDQEGGLISWRVRSRGGILSVVSKYYT